MADTTLPRRGLLAILLFGAVGAEVELLLLEHYEDPWQYLPLLLIAAALVVVIWNLAAATAGSVRTLRWVMGLFVVAGMLGVLLHFQGAAEFQSEIDPGQSRWSLVSKAMRAKAPPVLAPGLMVQLGLLGLLSTYRHPALAEGGDRSPVLER